MDVVLRAALEQNHSIIDGAGLTMRRVSLVILASYTGTSRSTPVNCLWLSSVKCPLDSSLNTLLVRPRGQAGTHRTRT